jgi:hypothetical protein
MALNAQRLYFEDAFFGKNTFHLKLIKNEPFFYISLTWPHHFFLFSAERVSALSSFSNAYAIVRIKQSGQ